MAAFAVAAAAGLVLSAVVDLRLLLVGAASIAAGWLYTGGPRPYGYSGFGEVFVFVFFGLVATVGSAYVHTEDISGTAVWPSVPVGLLASALLVVNNLRDIPTDTEAGKRTLAVRLGAARTRMLYRACSSAPTRLCSCWPWPARRCCWPWGRRRWRSCRSGSCPPGATRPGSSPPWSPPAASSWSSRRSSAVGLWVS